MKRLSYIAAVAIIFLSACRKEEGEGPLPLPPVIMLDSPTSVYTTKVGREIEIRPSYENVEDAVYAWTSGEKLIGEEPSLKFVSDDKGSHYITLTVTNAGGEDSEELRVDVLELALPSILLPGADKGFTVMLGASLGLVPVISSPSEVSLSWTVDGTEVSTDASYTFVGEKCGNYIIGLTATNEDGENSISFPVGVRSEEEVDFSWAFEQEEYNVSKGRTIRLRAIDVENAFDAEYIWSVNGMQVQSGDVPVMAFTAEEEGEYKVELQMRNEYLVASHMMTVNVCPPEGTYRRDAAGSATSNKVYEFLPAPGQFVNENCSAATMAEACAWAEERLSSNAFVSLGGFGGYIVVGFDHSVRNSGRYDIAIAGNPFDGASEPGIVYVMQDENGDGLPNDIWYEMKGSEYGKPETDTDYAVTYYRPDAPAQDVPWRDNRGGSGEIEYLEEFHRQDYYYPAWMAESRYTLRGVCLKSRSYDASGEGTYWVNPSFDWGYADNFSTIDRPGGTGDNLFRISDAVRFDGEPADLAYIDFVKIQTAVNQQCGWIGEVSTEVFGVKDYNMLK